MGITFLHIITITTTIITINNNSTLLNALFSLALPPPVTG